VNTTPSKGSWPGRTFKNGEHTLRNSDLVSNEDENQDLLQTFGEFYHLILRRQCNHIFNLYIRA
jgi:hypothetical protein